MAHARRSVSGRSRIGAASAVVLLLAVGVAGSGPASRGTAGNQPVAGAADVPVAGAADVPVRDRGVDAAGGAVSAGGRGAKQGDPEIRNAKSPHAIPGEFLVGLRGDVPWSEVKGRAQALVAKHGGTILAVLEILPGFGLKATDAQALAMAADPTVDVVERNLRGELRDTQIGVPLPWHLDRDDQRPTTLDGKFNHGFTGVPIYVVDSGVFEAHEEFEGRATNVNNFTTGGNGDCLGHGTQVASVAAGKTYGVSKRSPIRAVKVWDCTAGTNEIWMAEGLNHVALTAPRPAVVNFSLGMTGTARTILNQAARNVAQSGLTLTIAAANRPEDACLNSPDRVGPEIDGAIVVGGIQQGDARASFSAFGSCLSLFAPAHRIDMATTGGTAATTTSSGNSYAAPQVAAAAALILGQHPNYTPAQLEAAVIADSTKGAVTDAGALSPNRLLYVAPPDQPGRGVANADLNAMFRTYGDAGGHWTGGDETMSLKLPDGRVAWFFGDTMLGTVNADGSRPRNTRMIRNSVVVQANNALTLTQTLHGGTAADPQALVGAGNGIWWPAEGQVVGNELQVFYGHYDSSGSGPLDLRLVEVGIARFSASSLALLSLTTLRALAPTPNRAINWGAAMVDGVDGDNYTYIYGMERTTGFTDLYVARAPKGQVLGGAANPTAQWQFWTGSADVANQWSAAASDAVSIMTGVGPSFSVRYLPQYKSNVLVTFDESAPFSNRIFAHFAERPTGPFRHATLLYSAPEASGARWVYNARLHMEQNANGATAVVSYNVNSFDADELYRDARMYRPRFVNVTIPPPPTDASQLPNAPRNLVATSPADGQVRLTWTAPLQPVQRYWIYERKVARSPITNRDVGASQFVRRPDPVTTTSTTLGLLVGGEYEYRVSAENTVGEGPPSLPASVVVRLPAPSSAPANLTGVANPDGTISLSWQPVSAAGIVNYRVYQRDVTAGESTFVPAPSVSVAGTTAKVTNLTNGSIYEFAVAAFNGGGEGPRSNVVRLTARIAPPPAPTNLTATSNADGTIGLSWTAPGPDFWYWIYMRDVTAGETSFTRLQYPHATGTTFTAAYLTIGDTYEFYVTAIGQGASESPPSNKASARASVPPPPAPTGLTATANGDGTIALSWNSSGIGVWYWIYMRDVTAGQAFTRMVYPVANGTTFTAAYLTVGHTYAFYVTAIGPGQTESGPSNTVQARSTVPPPSAPTGLRATAGAGQVALTWTGPAPNTWYWVYVRDVTAGESFTRLTYPVTTGTSFTATMLTNGHTYEFYVTAIGPGSTESAPSNTVQARPQVPLPPAPTGLTATANSDGSIRLAWNAPGPNLWYWIYMRDVTLGQSFTRVVYPVTTGTSHTFTGLTLGHTYAFMVTAINAGGEGPPSNTAQATTWMPAPDGLVAWWEDNHAVYLSWNGNPNHMFLIYVRDVARGGGFVRQPLPTSGRTWQIVVPLTSSSYEFYVTRAANGGETGRSNIVSVGAQYPTPSAGNLSVGLSAGPVSCRQLSDYTIYICSSTIRATAAMSSWSTSFRADDHLNVEWRFTGGATDGIRIGVCYPTQAGVPPSGCELTATRTATWHVWTTSPPQNPIGPSVCIDTIAYAWYVLDAHGNMTQRRRTYWNCVTPGAPPA